MMKYLIPAFLCYVAVVADKLDNVYLPPSNARTAGGSGSFLNAPFGQRRTQSGSYASPGSFQPSQPSVNYGAPVQPAVKNFGPVQPAAAILRLNNEINEDGSYQFDFETENRIQQKEVGQLKNVGTDQESSVVQGSYSYVGDDGQTYNVNYVADELGFRATGDHLPVAPEIPAEILKSLEQNAADEAKGIFDDGQYRSEQAGAAKSGYAGGAGRQYLAPAVQTGYQQPKGGYRY
ncbi:hypothetical protein WA026_005743 [Henosepilachna vigintioctopunctata]|uniref:Uncharacterized protein n=1 Tax=Henosepilachna vigintioctopunctata TaxID=420089 RepID=A0AAW1TXC0_9CUCU